MRQNQTREERSDGEGAKTIEVAVAVAFAPGTIVQYAPPRLVEHDWVRGVLGSPRTVLRQPETRPYKCSMLCVPALRFRPWIREAHTPVTALFIIFAIVIRDVRIDVSYLKTNL